MLGSPSRPTLSPPMGRGPVVRGCVVDCVVWSGMVWTGSPPCSNATLKSVLFSIFFSFHQFFLYDMGWYGMVQGGESGIGIGIVPRTMERKGEFNISRAGQRRDGKLQSS